MSGRGRPSATVLWPTMRDARKTARTRNGRRRAAWPFLADVRKGGPPLSLVRANGRRWAALQLFLALTPSRCAGMPWDLGPPLLFQANLRSGADSSRAKAGRRSRGQFLDSGQAKRNRTAALQLLKRIPILGLSGRWHHHVIPLLPLEESARRIHVCHPWC
jgi:hypothetical protein